MAEVTIMPLIITKRYRLKVIRHAPRRMELINEQYLGHRDMNNYLRAVGQLI